MESSDIAAAVMTVVLVMAGVILAAIILARFGVPFAATGDRPTGGAWTGGERLQG